MASLSKLWAFLIPRLNCDMLLHGKPFPFSLPIRILPAPRYYSPEWSTAPVGCLSQFPLATCNCWVSCSERMSLSLDCEVHESGAMAVCLYISQYTGQCSVRKVRANACLQIRWSIFTPSPVAHVKACACLLIDVSVVFCCVFSLYPIKERTWRKTFTHRNRAAQAFPRPS